MCKGVEIVGQQKETKWETIAQLPPSVNFPCLRDGVQFPASGSAAAIQLLNFMFSTAADGALARVGGALQKF